jgi:hypothetical protein
MNKPTVWLTMALLALAVAAGCERPGGQRRYGVNPNPNTSAAPRAQTGGGPPLMPAQDVGAQRGAGIDNGYVPTPGWSRELGHPLTSPVDRRLRERGQVPEMGPAGTGGAPPR